MSALWNAEVVPGKESTHDIPFDLHLTQLVLPANANDKGRSVVEAKYGDRSFTLGSLKLDVHENVNVDLIFEAHQTLTLTVSGKNPVQLLGYFIDETRGDLSDDEDLDGEGFGLGDTDDDEIDSDEDDEEIDDDELTGATLQALTQKRKAESPQGNGAKKAKVDQQQVQKQQQPQKGEQKQQQKPQQQKGEAQQQPKGEQKPQQPKGEQKPQQPKGEQKSQQPKGEQKPQTPQQPKGEQKPQTPQQQKGEPKPQQEKRPQTPGREQQQKGGQQQQQQKDIVEGKKHFVKGVSVQTTTIGLGAVAQAGKTVKVMYVGRLENGKVFDRSQSPFAFRLGVGEVIKGWDIGVAGMRVGEKRKLVIPPNLGYGEAGALPDIPKDATLIFDVELIKV